MNEQSLIRLPEALAAIEAHSQGLNFGMASDPRTGSLLAVLAASKPAGRLLELGTGTGIATAWLLAGMDNRATLISVDVSSEFQAVARAALGDDPRLTLTLEDGAQFLQKQAIESFDLVFADAMPGKYESLDEALALVKPGGFYVIDDMLPQPNWPSGHESKAAALIRQLSTDLRFQAAPLTWASGVVVLVRRPVAPAP